MSLLARQLDAMRAVMAWEPKAWLMGGFAEDALLHGRSTRPHEDIDVVILREDLDQRLDQAEAMGHGHPWHLRMAMDRSRPLVIGSILRGVNLEFVVFDRDAEGRVYWEKPTPEGPARLYLPDDAFATPPATLDGVQVRTLSPRALYQLRAGVTDLFGGMRPKDQPPQAALRERYFAREPEELLAPLIVPAAPAG